MRFGYDAFVELLLIFLCLVLCVVDVVLEKVQIQKKPNDEDISESVERCCAIAIAPPFTRHTRTALHLCSTTPINYWGLAESSVATLCNPRLHGCVQVNAG